MQICHEMLVYKDIIHFFENTGVFDAQLCFESIPEKIHISEFLFLFLTSPIMFNIGIKFSYIKKKLLRKSSLTY